MKEIITICAWCKKELRKSSGAAVEKVFHFFLRTDVDYSHGICPECGVKLYGAELMARIGVKW